MSISKVPQPNGDVYVYVDIPPVQIPAVNVPGINIPPLPPITIPPINVPAVPAGQTYTLPPITIPDIVIPDVYVPGTPGTPPAPKIPTPPASSVVWNPKVVESYSITDGAYSYEDLFGVLEVTEQHTIDKVSQLNGGVAHYAQQGTHSWWIPKRASVAYSGSPAPFIPYNNDSVIAPLGDFIQATAGVAYSNFNAVTGKILSASFTSLGNAYSLGYTAVLDPTDILFNAKVTYETYTREVPAAFKGGYSLYFVGATTGVSYTLPDSYKHNNITPQEVATVWKDFGNLYNTPLPWYTNLPLGGVQGQQALIMDISINSAGQVVGSLKDLWEVQGKVNNLARMHSGINNLRVTNHWQPVTPGQNESMLDPAIQQRTMNRNVLTPQDFMHKIGLRLVPSINSYHNTTSELEAMTIAVHNNVRDAYLAKYISDNALTYVPSIDSEISTLQFQYRPTQSLIYLTIKVTLRLLDGSIVTLPTDFNTTSLIGTGTGHPTSVDLKIDHGTPGIPGYTIPGYTVPGYTIPGITIGGSKAIPAYTIPGYTIPGTAGVNILGQTIPGYTLPGARILIGILPAATYVTLPGYTIPDIFIPGIPGLPAVPPLTIPGGSFIAAQGTPVPINPTFTRAILYDETLNSWGSCDKEFKALVDFSPVNERAYNPITGEVATMYDYRNLASTILLVEANGQLSICTKQNPNASITIGDIGFSRSGLTRLLDVKAGFVQETGSLLEIFGSLDGSQLSLPIAASTRSLGGQCHLYKTLTGKWFRVRISGEFELKHLEFSGEKGGIR